LHVSLILTELFQYLKRSIAINFSLFDGCVFIEISTEVLVPNQGVWLAKPQQPTSKSCVTASFHEARSLAGLPSLVEGGCGQ
jgi:hypothetical protein